MEEDKKFLDIAYALAQFSMSKDEVPVGAVIVKDGKIVSTGYNRRERRQNALEHAEMMAIHKACRKLKSFRLNDCTLYVTLEPCPMCAGAIINARIKKVVFGAYDPKGGCFGSKLNMAECGFNHKPIIDGGLDPERCGKILSEYFGSKRKK